MLQADASPTKFGLQGMQCKASSQNLYELQLSFEHDILEILALQTTGTRPLEVHEERNALS